MIIITFFVGTLMGFIAGKFFDKKHSLLTTLCSGYSNAVSIPINLAIVLEHFLNEISNINGGY